EVAQGYKKIKEPAIFVKFPIQNPEFKNTSLLVWTTTPWTLPGNVAVAINPKFTYVKLKNGGDYLILAKDRIAAIGINGEVVEEFEGEKLIGLNYQPPFDFYSPDYKKEKIWETIPASFISLDEGTGLVHIAPAFGEEDMETIKAQNEKLKKKSSPEFPILLTVNEEGKFNLDVKKWAGMFVKEADPQIIEDLRIRSILFREEMHEHDYPFCWRCATPLLHYAKKSWFIEMSKVRKNLIENNQKINWAPSHLKEGRFGEWLKEAKDWAISRERYWGTPLPIWQCAACQNTEVIGSLGDLISQKFSKNKYFVIRHGEYLGNINKTANCWPEKGIFSLTKKGQEEAKLAAKKIKNRKIDLIFSSDLLRTKQTAEILGEELEIKPKFDKRLREINVGILNGKKIEEAGKFWSRNEKLSAQDYYLRRFKEAPPKGENYVQVEKRVYGFLKELEKKYSGKNIVIVSHARVLTLLEKVTRGYDLEKFTEIIKGKEEIKTGQLKALDFAALPHDENMEIDIHRPYIDEVKFYCKKCGGLMVRVPEVLDCWLDSGAMPFAQGHWPFELKTKNYKLKTPVLFPADYISEGIDQTRGWFYTLLAISTLLDFDAPYKNVISTGHVLDEKGEKMSKSKGNIVDPWYIIEKYGSDSVRWYFYTINQPGEVKLFTEKDIEKALKKFILILWNCFVFFQTYAEISGNQLKNQRKSASLLDKWIVSKLNQLILGTTDCLDKYDVTAAARAIERFVIEDLSLWHIRRSRRRFQRPENKQELKEASRTLEHVLLTVSRLAAPFIPFLCEEIFTKLPFDKTQGRQTTNYPSVPSSGSRDKL
ncbi:MAG: class I tRNA ligase family protein, partial [bacterium]|nr:class I tRNA ligase family protein [bacterium]